jgi:hypothetical protein
MTEKSKCHADQTAPLSTSQASAGSTTQLIPVSHWNQRHPWPPAGGLRHLIFFADTNGFNKVIRRIGRRVLIDEAAFFDWANSQGGAK